MSASADRRRQPRIDVNHPVVRNVRSQHPGWDVAEIVRTTREVIKEYNRVEPGLATALVEHPRRATHHEAFDELDEDGFDATAILGQRTKMDRDFAIAAKGLSVDEIRQRYPEINFYRAKRIVSLRTPLRERERKVALEADRTTIARTAAEYGVSYQTVAWYLHRLRFQTGQELEASG